MDVAADMQEKKEDSKADENSGIDRVEEKKDNPKLDGGNDVADVKESEEDSKTDDQEVVEDLEHPTGEVQVGSSGDKIDVDARAIANECTASENSNGKDDSADSNRVQLLNLPPYFSYKQLKALLARHLKNVTSRKIKCVKGKAYFSFLNAEDAAKAVESLSGMELKGQKLIAKLAKPEPLRGRDLLKNEEGASALTIITARESVTPLADIPYSEQLERKVAGASRVIESLIKQLKSANVSNAHQMNVGKILEQIRPSPRITAYRNKCEFTVGRSIDGDICVGFVRGRFAENQHFTLPIDGCDNISEQMKCIVKAFEKFVIDSHYPPFNEFERVGVWKMFTVREFSGDVLIIATVFPMGNAEEEKTLQKNFTERFLRLETLKEDHFRVTSVFWQRQANASDEAIYEHIGGAPYIYETILNSRFRVSPGAFFQTNTYAAEVLYTTITEKCGIVAVEKANNECTDDNAVKKVSESEELFVDEISVKPAEPEAKKPKIEEAEDMGTVLLDICCGTGTIGICVSTAMNRAKSIGKRFVFGVELVSEAIEDARRNALDNFFTEEQCRFVTGKAEEVFRKINYYIPSSINLEKSRVIGILDPPRAGIHEKVVLGCRMLSSMRRLVYVSCNPSMALKNLVDLCRPPSKKYSGEPFRITSVTPVDMFPQTTHCEWVIQLDR